MSDFGVLRLPAEVRFGWGTSSAVPALATGFGDRVAFVVDPFLAQTAAFARILTDTGARGAHTLVVTDVPPELPVDGLSESADRVRRFAPDVIVGIGGGSALDAAKLMALLVSHPGPPSRYYGENRVPGPVTPLIAVPTTAGTGSEVTPVAVVSDSSREVKVGISSPRLIPTVAVVDPELTVGAPPSVTAHAGIDAFVHAVESFTASPLGVGGGAELPVFVGRNILTDSLSLEAAALIFDALPRALEGPGDRAAREDMARASLLAGMAFGSAGTHLSHAIQYPVGALTHTPHGLGTGMLLPYVLQACLSAIPERLARLGVALGLSGQGDDLERAQATVDAVAGLCERIGLPGTLAELGDIRQERGRIIRLSLEARRLVGIAPVHADEWVIGAIVDAALAGDRAMLTAPSPQAEDHT
nr:iron-containing alcohol dehydrogenase [Microbacterium bovistercoris]